MATKIQALYRGFAFRVKRKRALQRLQAGGGVTKGDKSDDFELDPFGEDDFDAEAFLDVRKENLQEVDIFAGANSGLMEKYIQVLSHDYAKNRGGGGGKVGNSMLPPKPI